MTAINRRTFAALALASAAFSPAATIARWNEATPEILNCAALEATPTVRMDDLPMPYDQMYIDTMVPHHHSAVSLAQAAENDLEDERLLEIAQGIIETQSLGIDQLLDFRDEWYGSRELEQPTEEIMRYVMGESSACDGEQLMNLMDLDWVIAQYRLADDHQQGFIAQVLALHEMAIHQSQVALVNYEHE